MSLLNPSIYSIESPMSIPTRDQLGVGDFLTLAHRPALVSSYIQSSALENINFLKCSPVATNQLLTFTH